MCPRSRASKCYMNPRAEAYCTQPRLNRPDSLCGCRTSTQVTRTRHSPSDTWTDPSCNSSPLQDDNRLKHDIFFIFFIGDEMPPARDLEVPFSLSRACTIPTACDVVVVVVYFCRESEEASRDPANCIPRVNCAWKTLALVQNLINYTREE